MVTIKKQYWVLTRVCGVLKFQVSARYHILQALLTAVNIVDNDGDNNNVQMLIHILTK